MKSASTDCFFSCSFAEDDKAVNDFFLAICKALDIRCVNVGTAYSVTPPEKARQLINDAQGLIAVSTKRTKITDHSYNMPSAVHDELSIAYGLKTPTLMFIENEVVVDGFKKNYGTHLKFSRDDLYTADFIEKSITAIHTMKMDLVSPDELLSDQDTTEFSCDYHKALLEMKEDCDEFYWEYSISKKLMFKKPFKRAFKIGAWAYNKSAIPDTACPLHYEIHITKASKEFKFNVDVEKQTPDCFEASIKIEPHPDESDYLEFYVVYKSKYLNPIWDEEVKDNSQLSIADKNYSCIDGIIPITRTRKASYEFRFPSKYGLDIEKIEPFVGSFTSGVDYLVESEIKRMTTHTDSVAGNITIKMEIDSPLLRHLYGIAWNPKKRR